jgi:hypothetical protein
MEREGSRMDQHNSTLDELLSDPLIRLVMASDGVRIDEIRHLVEQARARMIQTNCQRPRYARA